MATKRMKGDNGMEQEQELEAMFEDRLSDLPDAIILHILSFLPTVYAVRMSLLSKRWRRMWTLVPVLDFCDARDMHDFRRCDERGTGRKKFYKFINECLKHPYADTTISKFKLNMEYYGGSSQMDSWLRFPVQKNVRELDLCFQDAAYCIPEPILHLSSLTLLKLSGMELRTLIPSSLPSMKELYLINTHMDDRVLNYLVLGCPSLEILRVNHCYGLVNPKVSSLSLKSMEFRTDYMRRDCQTIEVEAVNLHSFVHKQCGSCNIYLAHCRTIRNLSLSKARLTDLEDLIPHLPLLESLKLEDWRGLQHMQIGNQHLKVLVLSFDRRLDSLEATIDTPNLVSFSYNGCSMFKISVNAPNLSDACIKVRDYPRKTYDFEWYAGLIKFLSQFNGSKNVRVFCSNEKALIIPDEVKKMYSCPLPNLKRMKVQTGGRLFRKVMLRKSLRWIAPSLETLPLEQ